ncbi:MAG: transglycosylase domain-containing protein, partial [Acidobacteria bacterium]|nr:transglycosylase domain-containing protein [Acidobacteriota bacterium]
QQLVKNLFLTHERTFSRKAQEAILAVLVELRFDKPTILQGYLNEIYLGRGDGANLIGVGAAAHAYFDKDVSELDLAEAATLAGMIRAPANYSPLAHPDASLARRDLVLDRLVALGWATEEQVKAAKAEPLGAVKGGRPTRLAPYFASLVEEEVARRFGVEDLSETGYVILSTLDLGEQQSAEESVAWGLESLEKGWEKNHKGDDPLQAALVSIDVEDGGIRAYVGGRDFTTSQFDRASQARRQAGSAFKPVVYAAAFETGEAAPSTLVDDSPLTVTLAGRRWEPRNSDGTFDGLMSVRTAVERSRNVPTVRVALRVGLKRIVEMARGMGVSARLEPLPSLALGAFEVTPLEMTSVYGTLAAGGRRPQIHGVEAVFDAAGVALPGQPLPEREQILSPQSAYLLTSVLQGVFERGTAQRARQDGFRDPLAGKTGTTNDRRDSWFGGYSRDTATVVWVGYDDNSPTHLSGTRAALPIWARFEQKVRPPGGYGTFQLPPGISTAVIDPESGELATDECPEVITEVFLTGHEPTEVCYLHSDYGDRWRQRREAGDDDRRQHPFRRWLERVFRGRRQAPEVY